MKLAYRIKTWIRRRVFRKYFDNFATSFPLLSAYGFRSIAHFTFDQFSDFNPSLVKEGQIVYVKNDLLETYYASIHTQIRVRYILLTHGDDFTFGGNNTNRFQEIASDEKILHWYSSNLDFLHENVTLLPLGVENFKAGAPYNFIDAYKNLRPLSSQNKNIEILFGFTLNKANKEREEAFATLSNIINAKKIDLPRTDYYEALAKAEFIACPRGNGIDCHRVWEALYLHTIPVLIRNSFSSHVEQAGFPVLIIENGAISRGLMRISCIIFMKKIKANLEKMKRNFIFRFGIRKYAHDFRFVNSFGYFRPIKIYVP